MSGMQPDYSNVPGQPYNPFGPGLPPTQPISASEHKKHHHGLGVIIALILMTLLFFGAAGFGFWAFTERAKFKNDTDKLIAAAVDKAEAEQKAVLEEDFIRREKEPNKVYTGPEAFGRVMISFPKTWSAHVDESGKGGTPIDGYFHPNFVPGLKSGIAFALHLEVLESDYSQELKKFESAADKGLVKVKAIKAVNVPEADPGVRIDGEIEKGVRGSVVIFPLRDKTLKLTVESEDLVKDFDGIILKNLKFSP